MTLKHTTTIKIYKLIPNTTDCPLEGKCLQTNVIYQATVTTKTITETYVGLATNFKERYRNHKTSFRHSHRRNETELSKYVWNLQDAKKPFLIKWKILKKCKPYNNINKKCSLNRRNKLARACMRVCVHVCVCMYVRMYMYVCMRLILWEIITINVTERLCQIFALDKIV